MRPSPAAGPVPGDLSAFNRFLHEGEPWLIDFSDSIRVDRLGGAPWRRPTTASESLTRGLGALQVYLRTYGLPIDVDARARAIVDALDRFGVMRDIRPGGVR